METDVDPRVRDAVNKIAHEIICDRSYFTNEDDDNILELIDAKEDIMGNEERKDFDEQSRLRSSDESMKERGAIGGYYGGLPTSSSVKEELKRMLLDELKKLEQMEKDREKAKKKLKDQQDPMRGLAHFMGRYGPDDTGFLGAQESEDTPPFMGTMPFGTVDLEDTEDDGDE